MNRDDRHSVRRSEPSASGDAGRSGYRRSPEPEYRQGRQRDEDDNRRPQESDDDDGYQDNRRRDRSPDKERRRDQAKDLGKRARGRWKDAGEDQLRVERRQARQERLKKVMKLFEDSLLIDKVSTKERKPLMEDVRERLDEMKKEHAERMKEQITTHWSKLTEEGRTSRAKDNRDQDEDNPPRHRPPPARSGGVHNRDKNRYMSGETTHRGRGDPRSEGGRRGRGEEEDSEEDNPRQSHPRVANSGDEHNRARNRVMSGEKGYQSKGDNRRDRPDRRDGYNDRERNDTRKYNRSDQRGIPRGQSSGDVHNRNKNRLRSGDSYR